MTLRQQKRIEIEENSENATEERISAVLLMRFTTVLNRPQREKSTGRSIDAMFYIVVTLINPKKFKIAPLEAFEKIALFHFFTYDG